MSATYSKHEKLKSKLIIDQLFKEGHSIVEFPLRLVFIETEFDSSVKVKCAVSVSKKNFKNAVDRNRVKRLMREAYRLNKSEFFNNITTQYALMILYIGNNKPTFDQTNKAFKKLLERFVQANS